MSLSRAVHGTGVPGQSPVPQQPVPQQMDRCRWAGGVPQQAEERPDAESLSVQALTMDTVEVMRVIHNDGFGGKVCCLCLPVADTNGRIKRFYTKHPERLPMCGVALGQDGTPLGYVQLAIYPMNDKDGLHSTRPGETPNPNPDPNPHYLRRSRSSSLT